MHGAIVRMTVFGAMPEPRDPLGYRSVGAGCGMASNLNSFERKSESCIGVSGT